MKIVRAILFFLFVSLLLAMAGCPGLWDTKRRRIAFHNYRETPSEVTKAALVEAKRLDRRNIIVFEVVMGGIACVAALALLRMKEPSASH